MASGTDLTNNDDRDLRLTWSGRWSLAHRILALNLITVLLVALSTLYLEVLRDRLAKERARQTRIEAVATALAVEASDPDRRDRILATISTATGTRLRMFDPAGKLVADSWTLTGPTYELQDPRRQEWTKVVARALDRGFNAIVGAPATEEFFEPKNDVLQAWPEAVA